MTENRIQMWKVRWRRLVLGFRKRLGLGWLPERFDPELIRISHHAIVRWNERIRIGFTFTESRDDLMRILPSANLVDKRPDWIQSTVEYENAGFLVIGDDIAFPIVIDTDKSRRAIVDEPLVATTCIVRGQISPKARAVRKRKRLRRARRVRAASSR